MHNTTCNKITVEYDDDDVMMLFCISNKFVKEIY